MFISGYLVGAHPEQFYYRFTAQLCYFMPIRYYTYHARGYHYFRKLHNDSCWPKLIGPIVADMCYFVNFLLLLTIWVAPQSKRLLISTYCLAYGNNAVAIAMWRNSVSHLFVAIHSAYEFQLDLCTCSTRLSSEAYTITRCPHWTSRY